MHFQPKAGFSVILFSAAFKVLHLGVIALSPVILPSLELHLKPLYYNVEFLLQFS
jgi:hypothetical protein